MKQWARMYALRRLLPIAHGRAVAKSHLDPGNNQHTSESASQREFGGGTSGHAYGRGKLPDRGAGPLGGPCWRLLPRRDHASSPRGVSPITGARRRDAPFKDSRADVVRQTLGFGA